MPSEKLTIPRVKAFRHSGPTGRRCVLWDTDVSGFGVRAYAPSPDGNSRKAYVLSYRRGGRKRLAVIGDAAAVPLDKARKIARRWVTDIEAGLDPLEEKKKLQSTGTLKELRDAYIENHAKKQKKTWQTDERRFDRNTPALWLGRKAHEITTAEWLKLFNKISARGPYEANRYITLIKYLYRHGPVWGFQELRGNNPVGEIKKNREKSRKRWATPNEVKALTHAIDEIDNIYVRAALWLYLLTAVRKSELLEAKWRQVDWENRVLRFPETKSRDEQQATLNAAAILVLQAIPKVKGNPYILPGRKRGRHLVNIDKPWRAVRKVAKAEDLRLHDLRRTVGSWLSQSGVELNVLKDGLRHANISTTLTYARLAADPAREAFEEHGARLTDLTGGPSWIEKSEDG